MMKDKQIWVLLLGINLIMGAYMAALELIINYYDPGLDSFEKVSKQMPFFAFFYLWGLFSIAALIKNGLSVWFKRWLTQKISVNSFIYYSLLAIMFTLWYMYEIHPVSAFLYPLIPVSETLLFALVFERKVQLTKRNG